MHTFTSNDYLRAISIYIQSNRTHFTEVMVAIDPYFVEGLPTVLGIPVQRIILPGFFIAVLGTFILPIIALVQTINLIDDWLVFILVVLLQFVSIMLILNYYSSMTANKFLTNSLTDYADLNYQINHILLSNVLRSPWKK